MGVDYDNCDNCGEIYADCSGYGYCEGCYRSWCVACCKTIKTFHYGDEMRCDLCFSTDPMPIEDSDLLDFVEEKYGTTREELRKELKRARPEDFDVPENAYECQMDDHRHKCNPDCTTLGKNCKHPTEDLSMYATDRVRGLCCAAKFPAAKEKWCEECSKV